MATTLATLFPGCTIKDLCGGQKSIRFAAMISGKRFTHTVDDMPWEVLVDLKGRPTLKLRALHEAWAEKCRASMTSGVVRRGRLRQPTIGELVRAYEKIAWERNARLHKPAERSIVECLKNFRYCLAASGLGDSSMVSELFDPDMMQGIFDSFLEQGKRPVTAWTYLTSMQSMTAGWTISAYRRLGYEVKEPNVKAVDVGDAKRPAQFSGITPELREKMMAWFISLLDQDDPYLYVAASMVANLAMRPVDVVALTEDNFYLAEDGYHHVRYQPIKTKYRSGRWVDWPIGHAHWEKIREVAGARLDQGLTMLPSGSWTFHKLNNSMRIACKLPAVDGKAMYLFRKMCIDDYYHDPDRGPQKAVAVSGDRRETVEMHYSNPYKMEAVAPRVLESEALPEQRIG